MQLVSGCQSLALGGTAAITASQWCKVKLVYFQNITNFVFNPTYYTWNADICWTWAVNEIEIAKVVSRSFNHMDLSVAHQYLYLFFLKYSIGSFARDFFFSSIIFFPRQNHVNFPLITFLDVCSLLCISQLHPLTQQIPANLDTKREL